MNQFKKYYLLTKPGIIRGNLLPAIAGFCLASKSSFDFSLFFETLIAVSLVIACGCVLNNILDKDIDSKMQRTKKRALVTGEVQTKEAIIFGALLGIVGFILLATLVNFITVVVGFVGLFFYVVVYGLAKRKSVHGTLVGSISGAIPPVAGYTAVANKLDSSALVLFLILVFWQMPHFYSIAIFRIKDYRAAKLPVLPIVSGINKTKQIILIYICLLLLVVLLFPLLNILSYFYWLIMLGLCIWWFYEGNKKLKLLDSDTWAKMMFENSLIVLLGICLLISVGGLLK